MILMLTPYVAVPPPHLHQSYAAGALCSEHAYTQPTRRVRKGGMMDGPPVGAVPAAWYSDPGDVGQLRYWDGAGWTDQIAVLVLPSAAPPSASPFSGSGLVSSHEPLGLPAQSALFAPPLEDSSVPSSYVPLARFAPIGGGGAPMAVQARSADTAASWLLALWPLILLTELVVPANNEVTTLVIRVGIVAVFVVVSVLLAALDRSQLHDRGFNASPPPVLAVIPPLLVLARLIAVGARGVIVGFVGLVVQTAVALAVATALGGILASVTSEDPGLSSVGMVPPFTASERAALLLPAGMAAKISYDAQESALHYNSVECEPLPTTASGSVTTCTAEGNLSSYLLQVQVLPETAQVPFEVISVTPATLG